VFERPSIAFVLQQQYGLTDLFGN